MKCACIYVTKSTINCPNTKLNREPTVFHYAKSLQIASRDINAKQSSEMLKRKRKNFGFASLMF